MTDFYRLIETRCGNSRRQRLRDRIAKLVAEDRDDVSEARPFSHAALTFFLAFANCAATSSRLAIRSANTRTMPMTAELNSSGFGSIAERPLLRTLVNLSL